MTKDTSWGGPFAMLYDDGPWNAGGHEGGGAVAGDNKWGIAAFVSNTAADSFEYGAIRGSVAGADGQWIWVGGNGTFAVTAGATTPIVATGLTIAPFGTVDFRLVIDVSASGANLDAAFQGVDYTGKVKVKGSAWGWTEIAMTDDGTKGDKTSGDGKYTFLLSENIGPHDGLLKVGDVPEFIFVLDGVEYKSGAAAATAGVTAYSDSANPGQDACVTVTADCATEVIEILGNNNSAVTIGQ
ncbi:MAG: hypothetical protein U1F43_32255 [Myxococcota bacterium]